MLSIKELAYETSDAYSAREYSSWEACVRVLRKDGYNDQEINAILRSKVARWATKGKRPASSVDLITYVRDYKLRCPNFVKELVDETPWDEDSSEDDLPVSGSCDTFMKYDTPNDILEKVAKALEFHGLNLSISDMSGGKKMFVIRKV